MAEPSAKRARIDEAGTAAKIEEETYHTQPELFLLKKQNQALKGRFSEYKNTITALEKKVETLETRQVNYDAHLDVIGRTWQDLDTDLQLALSRVRTGDSSKIQWPKEDAKPTDESLLGRLLQAHIPAPVKPEGAMETDGDEDGEGDGDAAAAAVPAKDVEESLKKRTEFTTKLLSDVLLALDATASRNSELASALTSEDADVRTNNTVSALQTDNKSLRSSAVTVQNTLDQIQVHLAQTTAAKNSLQKAHAELARKVRDLSDQLYDSQELNKMLQRRVERAMNGGGSGAKGVDSGDTDAAIAPSTANGTASATGGDSAAQGGDAKSQAKVKELEAQLVALKEELSDVEVQSSGRLQEIKQLETERGQFRQQIDDLTRQVKLGANREVILRSPEYAHAHQQLMHAREALANEQSKFRALNAQFQDLTVLRNQERASMDNEFSKAQQQFTIQVTDVGNKLHQVQFEYESLANRYKELQVEQQNRVTMHTELTQLHTLLKTEGTRVKEAGDEATKAKEAAVEARKAWDAKVSELDGAGTLRERRIAQLESDLSQARATDAQHGEEVKALKAKIETLEATSSALQQAHTDRRPEDEIRQAAAAATLRAQNAEQELEKATRELTALKEAARDPEAGGEWRKKCEEAQAALATAQVQIANSEGESEAVLAELDSLTSAFNDVTDQNARLLNQIDEKDKMNVMLTRDRLRKQTIAQWSKEERAAMEKELTSTKSQLSAANEALNEQKNNLNTVRLACEQHNIQLKQRIDMDKKHEDAATRLQNQVGESNAMLESAKAELAALQKTRDENATAVDTARSQLKRAQEESASYKRKYERAKSKLQNASGGDAGSEEELRRYRKLFKCNVCRTNTKEMVITKCGHMLCGPCLRKNLETRHRKCPSCGKSFGQDDAKPIYF